MTDRMLSLIPFAAVLVPGLAMIDEAAAQKTWTGNCEAKRRHGMPCDPAPAQGSPNPRDDISATGGQKPAGQVERMARVRPQASLASEVHVLAA